MENPEFLKQKYDLHNAPEVGAAAERTEKRTGEKVSQNPADRIQNYLDRLKNVFNPPKLEGHPNFDRQQRNVEMLKKMVRDRFATKMEDVPDSYLENQLRERGASGDYNQASDKERKVFKKKNMEPVLRDQWASLEQWIDYFASPDSSYIPDYLKYWVFRELTGLQEYDKENKKFPKRSKGTVNKFPDLNHEALGYVIDAVIKKYQGKPIEFEYDIQPEEKQKFEKYLQGENFAKLYGWSVELINPIPEHLLPVTDGEWRKYSKGSEHHSLVESIRGRGTGWCTAGENTARTQLNGGDFYVFYSMDNDKKPTIPRIAIRMDGNNIGEIRGVAYKQNLDPYMGGVLEKKLNEKDKFPDKDQYLKKDYDMRQLTELEKKTKKGEDLTKDDLIFLYEIDSTIDGFGYQRDPRIKEIRDQKNPKEDMLVIFECSPDQIAEKVNEVNENTRAYVGAWNVDIFQKIRKYPNVKHLFESFPDKKIFMQTLETDPKIISPESAEKALRQKNIYLTDNGRDILYKTEFSKESQKYELVRFAVEQLGFPNGATVDEIYEKAESLGLELCPAEVGPHLRLQYPGKEWMLIAMKQITNRNGFPDVFDLYTSDEQLPLNGLDARPSIRWASDHEFVFRFSPSSRKTEEQINSDEASVKTE
ncbi:MAG: hypothetical protein HY764_02225 [Candidatus Portnoybacteria bacterium]|nr:hypothetical protein [Candidatus Portnoybacteria bacterium]